MRGVLGVHGAHGGRALHAGRRSHAGFPRAFSAEASASIGFPGVSLWMPLSSYRSFPSVIRDSLDIFLRPWLPLHNLLTFDKPRGVHGRM